METITNFRDLGGLTTRNNQQIKPKKILRSGELSRVSADDQQQLLSIYRLEKIIDLRSQDEVVERPDVVFEKTEYVHIDIFKNMNDEGASVADFSKLPSAAIAREYMNQIYQTMALNVHAQAGFTQVIENALNVSSESSFLFHCFAGKDRTGISAALLLEILEVPRDTIYRDYLATNKLRVKENNEVIQSLVAKGATQEMTEALKVALTVESPYLDTFYQTVEQEFGGIQPYLVDTLKISPAMQRELKQRVLVD